MTFSTTKKDQKSRLTKAYDEGRSCFDGGKAVLNPYPEESQRWYDWEFGWGEACVEKEQLNVRSGT